MDLFVERMRCIPRIVAFLNRKHGRGLSPEDQADLSQDVFAKIWARLASFQGEASLETWVFPFCDLTMRNRVRKQARLPISVENEESVMPAAQGDDRSADTPLPMDLEFVDRSLGEIPGDEAEVIRLKLYDDITFETLSEQLGISPNTAKSRYYRGIKRLDVVFRAAFGSEGF